MIKMLKIKDNKETWNQASRIQVRGGLLGYEDQSTSGRSKYCYVKVLLNSQSAVQGQSTARDWRLFKVLLRIRTNMQYCLKDCYVIL